MHRYLGAGAVKAIEIDILGGDAVERAEAVFIGGVLPVEPGLFVVGPFEREAGLGGFGPVGDPEGFAPGPACEGELAVEESGAGVDHDLAAGGGFNTGDPLCADVVEVVLGEAGVGFEVHDGLEFKVPGVDNCRKMVGLLFPVFVGFEVVVDAARDAEAGSLVHVALEQGVDDLGAFGGFDEGEGDGLGEGLLPVDFSLPAGDVDAGDWEIGHDKVP